jgi:hypothetical protein
VIVNIYERVIVDAGAKFYAKTKLGRFLANIYSAKFAETHF